MIYIGRSTCGYCVQFVPVLTQVQKELGGYTTYYIDIAKILEFVIKPICTAAKITTQFCAVERYP